MSHNRFERECPACKTRIPDDELFCQKDWFALTRETRERIRSARDLYRVEPNPATLRRLKALLEAAKLELRVKANTPPPKLEVVR